MNTEIVLAIVGVVILLELIRLVWGFLRVAWQFTLACLMVVAMGSLFTDYWWVSVVSAIGILGIYYGSIVRSCQICAVPFAERATRHQRRVEGRKRIICSRCNTKLDTKESQEGYNDFMADEEGEGDERPRRSSIPSAVKQEVWQRDQGCCVDCGSNELLEFDHIIPVAKGGANTSRNIQLLCEACNRSKSDKIL